MTLVQADRTPRRVKSVGTNLDTELRHARFLAKAGLGPMAIDPLRQIITQCAGTPSRAKHSGYSNRSPKRSSSSPRPGKPPPKRPFFHSPDAHPFLTLTVQTVRGLLLNGKSYLPVGNYEQSHIAYAFLLRPAPGSIFEGDAQ